MAESTVFSYSLVLSLVSERWKIVFMITHDRWRACGCHFNDKHSQSLPAKRTAATITTSSLRWVFNFSFCFFAKHNCWCQYIENWHWRKISMMICVVITIWINPVRISHGKQKNVYRNWSFDIAIIIHLLLYYLRTPLCCVYIPY